MRLALWELGELEMTGYVCTLYQCSYFLPRFHVSPFSASFRSFPLACSSRLWLARCASPFTCLPLSNPSAGLYSRHPPITLNLTLPLQSLGCIRFRLPDHRANGGPMEKVPHGVLPPARQMGPGRSSTWKSRHPALAHGVFASAPLRIPSKCPSIASPRILESQS